MQSETFIQDFENKADTGLIMSSTRWLIDHYKAKEKYRKQMVEDLDLKSGDIVLDVASGPGLWSNLLAAKVAPHGRVVGIDCSAEAISYAEKNLEKSPYQNLITYSQADFFNLPYSDATFDLAFCGNTLMYFPDSVKQKIIKEQQRVVKEGGKVASKEYDGDTIINYPIPSELWLKLKSGVAQALANRTVEEYYDEYVARKIPKIFLNLGLKDISTIPYPIQIFSPLSSHQINYITEESRWLIKTATPYLTSTEISTLESFFDPNSTNYILNREDFSYFLVEFMSIGKG